MRVTQPSFRNMRLLILTQAVDLDDPVLGFFHRWIEELATRYEFVYVICLKEGRKKLPENVRVYSLGKEQGSSRFTYVTRFYLYIWKLRRNYDAVFVHMNQEYVILGGLFWRLFGKPIYLWRNYYAGTLRTDIAVALSTKVFCTSQYSYTAGRAKTVLMPVGVDTGRFSLGVHVPRTPGSILFLAGMWPSKRPELLVDALAILHREGISFSADFYGSPLPVTEAYYGSLKERVTDADLSQKVGFYPGVPNETTPDLYRAHEIFVNCSPSGMFDKTLFEAAASGCLVLASSRDFAKVVDTRLVFPELDAGGLAQRLKVLLALPEEEKTRIREQLQARTLAEHSLTALGVRLAAEIH